MLVWLGMVVINPFHVTGSFLYPLKTSENIWFSDVFRGYRKTSGMELVNGWARIIKHSLPQKSFTFTFTDTHTHAHTHTHTHTHTQTHICIQTNSKEIIIS